MIAAGNARGPGAGVALGAGGQIIAVEFKKAGSGESQFNGGGAGTKQAFPVVCQQMADQRCWNALDELLFFITTRMSEKDGFFAFELAPAGLAGPPKGSPARRLPDFDRRSGCVPAEPYPPPKQPRIIQIKNALATGAKHYSTFDRTDPSGFDRTTTGISLADAGRGAG